MRKICVVVANRANYGRVKSVLKAIDNHPDLQLQLIVSASMLLDRYGQAVRVVESDGFSPDKQVYYILEGESPTTQAKSTGLGVIELSTAFDELKPDVVITVADRFETMATAIAASYMNIPLAHIQGGEITGNIDETVRHAITKLAHYHFPSTEQSKERILKMGEEEWRVINTGCPSIDALLAQDLDIRKCIDYRGVGIGKVVDFTKPYLIVIQHPVTTEYGKGYEQVMETLEAVKALNMQALVMWPNPDAGSDRVSKAIRFFHNQNQELPIRYCKNFPPEVYNTLLANAACAIGNSSSFIREGSYLGLPVVLVGNRQEGREHGENIAFVDYDRDNIYETAKMQLTHGKYPSNPLFGKGDAGVKIAEYLSTVRLEINKRMTY